jgi:hypothetical protein
MNINAYFNSLCEKIPTLNYINIFDKILEIIFDWLNIET